MELLDKHFLTHSIITNKEAEKLGIKRNILADLAQKGILERLKNGVYKDSKDITDDFTLISANNEKVIFSYQTALFLWDLTDRVPNTVHISVPRGYNTSHIKKRYEKLKIHYVKKENFEIGITTVRTPFGNEVKVYDMERTICDIVSQRDKTDKQIFIEAITGYFKTYNKNIRNLIKYSKILQVENKIRTYIEVLQND